MPTKQAIRERLLARRRELLTRYRDELERVEEELASRDITPIEGAAAEWDARVLSSLGDADVHAIVAVMEALRRLEHGTYGRCEACGDPIGVARLDAQPEAASCIACARGAEQVARSA